MAVLAGALVACSGGETGSHTLPSGTPVVFVSIDTLRADRLPAYGYAGVETPAIDALRREGVLFTHAYSHTPLTLPSHTSVLTGLLPGEHGLRDNVGYTLDREAVSAGRLPYLPVLLRRAGYATGGAVSSFVLRGRSGLDEGFDTYEDGIEISARGGLGQAQRPGGATLSLLAPWLASVSERPFFLFFHLYEPHTPYTPPEPFASRYADRYDGEVATADALVGELLEELRRLGVYDRALVVLFSDHGEGLGDHGEDEHGILLYQTTLHVPLLVRLPGAARAGSTVDAAAGLVDLVPTVLDLLGLPQPEGLDGRPLLATATPLEPRRIYSETYYPRLHFGWSELTSLTDGRYHLISGPDPQLFDLSADPGETVDVRAEERRVFSSFREEVAAFERPLVAPGAVDEESRRALAALGYAGVGPSAAEGPLPDPKDRMTTLRDLMSGFRHHSAGEHAAAVESFRRALVDNPEMLDAWEYLGRSLQQLGRRDEALDAYSRALEISGGSPQVAISAASLYFDLGRLDEAESHARLSLDTHPSFAHGLLAQIALARDDLDGAEREARLAMDDEQPRIGPNLTLAGVLRKRGRYEDALALCRKTGRIWAERPAQDPDLVRGLSLLEGETLADLGRVDEAEAAFRREMAQFPDQLPAYSRLALLLALAGRGAEVGPLLQQMVQRNPTTAGYAEAVRALRAVGDERSATRLLTHALRTFPGSGELAAL